MIIDCISDLHGESPSLEGGDLLIVAGDLTARDYPSEHKRFKEWLHKQPYDQKVYIAGNHDGMLQEVGNYICEGSVVYLCDDFFMYKGLKIYGSPWTPTFCDWYFMKNRGEDIRAMWNLIPEDTDILITHGPPYGVLDNPYKISASKHGRVGCLDLLVAMERIKPKLHVFGHIHGGYGRTLYKHEGPNTICVNAAHMNEDYDPVNPPIRVIL